MSASQSHDILRQQLMEELLAKLQSALSQQPLNLDYLEFLTRHELMLFSSFSEQIGGVSDITQALQNLHNLVQCEINDSSMSCVHYETEIGPGSSRPRILLEKETIERLLDTHLPVACIAKCLGVSRRTVYRRMKEFNLSVRGSYSAMTDQELDQVILSIKHQMPNAGYRMVQGHLVSMGLRIQWWRMRASVHRVDAAGIFSRIRELGCIMRRSYSVRGPLSLLHIDTNHKLIRYNMVIFGGVDGYSRKILYLDAATDNRAKTAFSLFHQATQLYGLPSRVRADQGVENVDIARFMFEKKGTGRASFISGKSVHNQRIERLWRDVWVAVTSKYHNILHSLEEDGLLDISDVVQIFGVHYIFVPRLQADLEVFMGGWNNHPLRTEEGLSPEQLWTLGHLQDLDEGERLEILFLYLDLKDLRDPGIDWESAVLQEENCAVVVPEIECPLDENTLGELHRTINPLDHSEEHGRDLYIEYNTWCQNNNISM